MKRNLLLSLRLLLAGVFIVSGFQKLLAPYQNFAAVVEKFQVLPPETLTPFAQALPWAEFVLGVFLAVGLWESASFFALWAMNSVFIGVLASTLARKIDIGSCGCFGEAVKFTPAQILAVDAGLWALFFVFFRFGLRAGLPALDRASHGRH